MSDKKYFSNVFFILISSIILINTLFSVNMINASYNIEEGDTFHFKITTLHDFSDSNITYTNTAMGVTFANGSDITVTVVNLIEYTETADILCQFLVDDYAPFTTPFLSQYIFVNRNWDELEEVWAPPVFETYETRHVWGVKSYASGEMEIEFVKKDGILNRFYAYNYTMTSAIGILEILIERTDVNLGGELIWLWILLPSLILGFSLIAYLCYKRNKK